MLKRFYNIEFLRVVLTFSIIFYHLQWTLFNNFTEVPIYSRFLITAWSGDQAVDFFFILAGFFLVYTYKEISLLDFIKRKIIRLWPVILFCFILKLLIFPIVGQRVHGWDLSLSLFFMDAIGWNVISVGETWFVSVLFWVSIFYFYLIKHFDKSKVFLTIALITWFCYTFEIHANQGGLRGVEVTWGYVFNTGLMRALGGIGIGCLIAKFYQSFHSMNSVEIMAKPKYLMIGIIELILLLFVISIPLFIRNPFHNIIILVIAFVGLVVLFLIEAGWVSKFLNKSYWQKLSRYSYSIYLTHLIVIYSLKPLWLSHRDFVIMYPVSQIVLVFFLSVLVGFLVFHSIEKPGAELLKKFFFANK